MKRRDGPDKDKPVGQEGEDRREEGVGAGGKGARTGEEKGAHEDGLDGDEADGNNRWIDGRTKW